MTASFTRHAALARRGISTEFIDSHDKIDEDTGHKIRQHTKKHPTYGDVTVEVDYTALFRNAPRRTANYEIFRIEAERVADGEDPENAAIPTTAEVAERVRSRLEAQGLTPAWEVAFGDE